MARTPKHGTISMYNGARCRCEACRLEWNRYRRVKYAEKRAALARKIAANAFMERQAERNERRRQMLLMAVLVQSIPLPLHSPLSARILNRLVSNAA